MGLRDAFNLMGYAVAYSSYSSNGWAVKEGVSQTHQLRGLFKSHFGEPRRSYIIGFSMGGLITVAIAEKFGQQYDGGLSACGAVGGGQMTWDYMFDTRAVFDYYYPGVLPGDALYVPDELTFPQVQMAVVLATNPALGGDPTGLLQMSEADQLDFPSALPPLNTLLWRLWIHTLGVNDVVDRTEGHVPFDNMGTVYTFSGVADAALNAGVSRFASTPDAANYLEHHYEPTGRLRIPVLTLRNAYDQLIPVGHEEALESIVDAAGADDLLVQQYVESFSHCDFSVNEWIAAFEHLVAWVEDDVVPPPGELIP
jgi:dienelactone hydrolase